MLSVNVCICSISQSVSGTVWNCLGYCHGPLSATWQVDCSANIMENVLPGLLEGVSPTVRQKNLWFQRGETAVHCGEGFHQSQKMTDIPKKVDWMPVFSGWDI